MTDPTPDSIGALVERLRGLSERATAGPWRIELYGDGDSLVIHDARGDWRVCFMATPGSDGDIRGIEANADLIIETRNALPHLIQSLTDLTRERGEARARVGELEGDLDRERQKVAWPAMYQHYWDGLARIKLLEGVLEPFVEALDDNPDHDDHSADGREIWETDVAMAINFGHLRTARSALRTAASSGRG